MFVFYHVIDELLWLVYLFSTKVIIDDGKYSWLVQNQTRDMIQMIQYIFIQNE